MLCLYVLLEKKNSDNYKVISMKLAMTPCMCFESIEIFPISFKPNGKLNFTLDINHGPCFFTESNPPDKAKSLCE